MRLLWAETTIKTLKTFCFYFCPAGFAAAGAFGFEAKGATELHVSSLLNMAAYINKVKTICFPLPLSSFCRSHWLACSSGSVHDMLHEDWELHWAQGKQGEFCFSALLGTGPQLCLMSDRSQPERLALFPLALGKNLFLTLGQGFFFSLFFWLGWFFCTTVGFHARNPTFPFTFSKRSWALATCHIKAEGRYYYHIASRVSQSKCNVLIGAPWLSFTTAVFLWWWFHLL